MKSRRMKRDDQPGGGSDSEGHLRLKVGIFALGAAFGIGGMAMESRPLLWIGTGILFAGVLVRFLQRLRDRRNSHSPAPGEEGSMEDETTTSPPEAPGS
jgi:hypothetical protein